MIKVEWNEANSIVLVHIYGMQSTSGFLQTGDELFKDGCAHAPYCILFDWSDLQSWPFGEVKSASIASWVNIAAQIFRAAIVHERRWNRQAAWVAALMRLNNTQVRSWSCGQRDQAIAWLNAQSGQRETSKIDLPHDKL